MPDDDPTTRECLDLARSLARETRALVLRFVERGFTFRRKADRSFVTEVDLAVEDRVRERIAMRFPDHAVLGEERDRSAGSSAWEWVVDPIDGTHSFRLGLPLYGTLIALRHHGLPVVGVIDLPGLDRCYSGARGCGVERDGRRLGRLDAGPAPALEDEIVACGDRKQFDRAGRLEVFDGLMGRLPTARTYADCFGHALALDGALGAMVDFGLRPWDVAATEALITEAGGRFVSRPSRAPSLGGPSCVDVVFGKPEVVEHLLALPELEAWSRGA